MSWDDNDYASFDFETSGDIPEYALQPWRAAKGKMWATSLVWLWRNDGDVRHDGDLFPQPARIREMLEWALDEGRILVGWNAVYDISLLYAFLPEPDHKLVDQCRFLDAMLLWRHLDIEPEYDESGRTKRSYSLKVAVPEFFPKFAGYEKEINYHTTDPNELRDLHDYNVMDCAFTLRLAKKFWNDLRLRQQTVAITEARSLQMMAKSNLNGLIIDPLEVAQLSAHLKANAAKALKVLAPHGVTKEIAKSPVQLSKLLFDDWKLPVYKENKSKKTEKVSRSTDKEVLYELAFIDPRAKVLRDYREALNCDTKFAIAPQKAALYNEDGRAHPLVRVFGTYSGRMTYSSKQGKNKDERQIGFALHQEKREAKYRRIVKPPRGYTLVEFDAAGQEFKLMAIASKDPVMLKLCLPGEDAHSFMGAKIGHVDYQWMLANKETDKNAKNFRKSGKVGNLSLQYRTSAPRLRVTARVDYLIPMTLDEAKMIHRVYRNTYKRVPIYWNEQIERTKQLGYVETFAGRRVKVQGDWSGPRAWSMGSTAINYRIQGTGADQKYLALMMLADYLDEVGAIFGWDLHDGLYFYVPDAKVYDFLHYVKDILDNLPYEAVWKFPMPIPLTWDAKVGPSWGDLKEYHFT